MLAYNIWRYLKMIAQIGIEENPCADVGQHEAGLQGIVNNTIRIARLKLLFIAAKVVKESNVDKIKYSIHGSRTPAMIKFLKFLDKIRLKKRPWEENNLWPLQFGLQPT